MLEYELSLFDFGVELNQKLESTPMDARFLCPEIEYYPNCRAKLMSYCHRLIYIYTLYIYLFVQQWSGKNIELNTREDEIKSELLITVPTLNVQYE